jgi:Replication-relaxation
VVRAESEKAPAGLPDGGGSEIRKVRERGRGIQRRERVSRRPSRVTAAHTLKLAEHLSERDRCIAVECYEQHVLTTDQLTRLYFTGARLATRRLNTLYELRVLDRFRPMKPRGEGTAPYHWILDEAGAIVVADYKGIAPDELHYNHADALGLASSRNLTHHVESNEFFTRLAVESVRAGGELSEWYGVRTLARLFANATVPDGYGVLTLPERRPLHLLLELDRGTEASRVLRAKAESYTRTLPHSSLAKLRPVVILAVPSERRAQTAVAAVADAGGPLVVAVWSAASSESVLAVVKAAALRADQVACSSTAARSADRSVR